MLKCLLSNMDKCVKLTEETLKNVKNYDDFITKVGDNMYKINDGEHIYYTDKSGVNMIIGEFMSMIRNLSKDKLQKFQSKYNEIRTNIETNTLLLSKQE